MNAVRKTVPQINTLAIYGQHLWHSFPPPLVRESSRLGLATALLYVDCCDSGTIPRRTAWSWFGGEWSRLNRAKLSWGRMSGHSLAKHTSNVSDRLKHTCFTNA